MTILQILFGVLFFWSSNTLISKKGIGNVTFDKKVSAYNNKNYYEIDKNYYTDEAGDSTYYVTLFLNKNHFIAIEADPVSKNAISMYTNSPAFYTKDSIRVGSTFEQLVNKYDGLKFLDGDGGELSVYLRKENIIFQIPDLSFKNGFDENKKQGKLALLKNVSNKKVTVQFIKVINYPLPI